MMREQVIISSVNVLKKNQLIHFQIRLPMNTKRIIGIETSAKLNMNEIAFNPSSVGLAGVRNTLPLFKRNIVLGDLKLQSCENANIFYATDIQLDKNTDLFDFSNLNNWKSTAYTHQQHSWEEIILVDGESTIIQGLYKDSYDVAIDEAMNYTIKIYLWIEIELPDNN